MAAAQRASQPTRGMLPPELEIQAGLAATEAECSTLQNVEDAKAAITRAGENLARLQAQLEAGASARKRLRDAAIGKPDATSKISQKNVDEIRRLKKQPPLVIETVVCAVCTLLMQQRRKQQRDFMQWDEALRLLPRCDWFAFKAFDSSQLLLAPEVMLAVQGRLDVSKPYRADLVNNSGDEACPPEAEPASKQRGERVTGAQALKASEGIGKLFGWCERVIAGVEELRTEVGDDDRQAAATVEPLERAVRLATEQMALLRRHQQKLEAIERCAEQAAALVQVTAAPPLEVNLEDARAAMAAAQHAGVEATALSRAAGLIEAVEKRQKARAAAAAALNQLMDVALFALSIKKARVTVEEAERAGVEAPLVARAREHVRGAEEAQQRREAARKEMERVSAIGALKLPLDELQSAIDAAIEAGVIGDSLTAARQRHAEASQKQEARDGAAAALHTMMSGSALALELSSARREVERARACGVAAEVLTRAGEVLAAAAEAQERRDAAQRRLVKLCEAPSLALPVEAARAAVEAARAAGVADVELASAAARVDEAVAAQAGQAEASAALLALTSAEPLALDVTAARLALGAARSRGVEAGVCTDQARQIEAAAKAQAACAKASAVLALLLDTPPSDVLIPEAAAALAAARAVGAADALLTRGEAHVAAAKQAQAARVEARRRMEELARAPPLQLDLMAARASVDAAREAGVAADAVTAAIACVDAAAAAQTARNSATRELLKASGAPALEMDVGAARAALKVAFGASVAREALSAAKSAVDAAEKAQTALASASQALEQIKCEPLLGLKVGEARAQIDAAEAAGVGAAAAAAAREHVDRASAAQEEQQRCRKAVQDLLATPALELGLDAARQALQAAADAGVPEALSLKGKAHVDGAERAQLARDKASAAVTSLMGVPPLGLPVKEARAVLAAAKKAGVRAETLELAAELFKSAAQAQQALARALAELEAALKPPDLKMDVGAARAAIEAAREAAASEEEVAAAVEKVDASAAAQQRRDEAVASLEVHMRSELLELDVETARGGLSAAREAGAEESSIAHVVAHIKAAAALQAKAATAQAELERHTGTEPLRMDLAAARSALEAAVECKVDTMLTDAAAGRIETAVKAREARDTAAAAVKAILGEKHLHIALDAARAVLAAGTAAGVASQLLEKAGTHVQAAADTQAKVESDLLALSGAALLEMDVGKARKCLEVARSVASISAQVTATAEAKIHAADVARQERDAAAAALKAVLKVPPLQLDVAGATARFESATAAGVAQPLLDEAGAVLRAAMAKQGERDGAAAELLRLSGMPPYEMDVGAARGARQAAEKAGVAADAVEQAAAKIEAAARQQAARTARAKQIEGLLKQGPLAVDLPAARQLVQEAKEAGVEAGVLEQAGAYLAAAEVALAERAAAEAAAKARREAAAAAVQQLLSTAPLQLSATACEQVLDEAKAAGVAGEVVASLEARSREAAKARGLRDRAAAELASLVQTDLLKLDLSAAAKALHAAEAAGVPADSTSRAAARFVLATEAQGAAAQADKVLDRLLETPLVYIEIDESNAEIERAAAAGACASKVSAAAAHVEKAAGAQRAMDAAAHQLQELIATPPLEVDVAAAKASIELAHAAGVEEHLLISAARRVETAEAEQGQQVEAAALLSKYERLGDDMIQLDAARDTLAQAKAGGVSTQVTTALAERLDRIEAEREAELSSLEKELVASPPLDLDLRDAQQRVDALLNKHISEHRLKRLREAVRLAGEAQRRRDQAWNNLLALADVPPGEMDVELAQEIFKEAWEAGVDEQRLEAVVEIVEREAEVQQRRDDAVAELNRELDPGSLSMDLAGAKLALLNAQTCGVAAGQLAIAQQRIDEAAAAQKRRDAKRDEKMMDDIVAEDLDLELLMDEIGPG